MARKRVVNGSFVWISKDSSFALGVYFEGFVYTSKNICQEGKGTAVQTDLPEFVLKNLRTIRDSLMPKKQKGNTDV